MRKSTLKDYLITVGVAVFLMALVVAWEAYSIGFTGNGVRIASDACFVSGMLLLVISALTLVANGGGFHPFGYLRKRTQYVFTGKPEYLMTYTEYVLSQKDKGKSNLTHLVVVGAVLLACSLLMALI